MAAAVFLSRSSLAVIGRCLIRTGIAAAALVSVLVPALGAGPAVAAGTSRPVPAIAGHRCPAGSAGAMVGGFLCAAVVAPLDYRDPVRAEDQAGRRCEHAATGPSPARRDLHSTRAGPASAGTVLIPAFIGLVAAGVLLRDYDIVSWDPARRPGRARRSSASRASAAESAFLGDDAYFPARPGPAGWLTSSRWRDVREDLRGAERCAAPARVDRGHGPGPGPAAPAHSARRS